MSAKGIFLGSVALLAFCAAPAWAAVEQAGRPAAQPEATTNATDNSDPGIGEIIVTANKRAQNQQVVPISIVAFTGESLKTQGVISVVDLPQITPGLGFTRTLVGTNAFLRGVGTTSAGYSTEAPIATYIDGLYLPNSAASSFSFNNVERIEVLKGPQGTLYGRNTTGGLIHVITKEPATRATIRYS
jgi:iron complex outermembrane receptor protein